MNFFEETFKLVKSFNDNPFFKGLFLTFVLLAAQFNLVIGIPISLLLFLILFYDSFSVKSNLFLKFIVIFKLSLISVIWFFFSNKSFFNFLQIVCVDIFLLLILSFRLSEVFFKGVFFPLLLFFLANFIFIIYCLIVGNIDLGVQRVGDFLPRFVGLLNSPIALVNLNFVMFFYCFFFQKYKWAFFAAFISILSGSLRAPALLFSFFLGLFFIKNRMRMKYLFLGSILNIVLIFSAVFLHANEELIHPYDPSTIGTKNMAPNGSAMRIRLWENALLIIKSYPILGKHDFSLASPDHINTPYLIAAGVAESTYLQYMMDWGILVGLLHAYILYYIFIKNRFYLFNSFKSPANFKKNAVVSLAYTCFIDSFYNSFFSSFFVLFFVGLLIAQFENDFKVQVISPTIKL